MKKVLITGITGFAGSHLAEYLVSQGGYEVAGTSISDKEHVNLAAVKDQVKLYGVNLLDFEATAKVVAEIRPEVIYHLAALPTVADSFSKPAEVIANNVNPQINLLEAVRINNIVTEKIIIVSSSNVYGTVTTADLPISETTPLRPDNPYSVSKITQDYLGLSYFLSYKLPIVRIRPTNHGGARLSPGISISRFAKIIAEIEKGIQEPVMKVGNLTTRRDFLDVHDVARGYLLAAEQGVAGEVYNLGSGISYSMQDVLNMLLEMSKVKINVIKDQALFRPSDIPELRIDSTKFRQVTGWKPEIQIGQTLRDTLDYWRKIV